MTQPLERVHEGSYIRIGNSGMYITRVDEDHGVDCSSRWNVGGRFTAEQLAAFGYEALTTEEALEGQSYPKVGEDVYMKTSLFIGHGEDDFIGGLCKVARVRPGGSGGKIVPYITVEEKPGWETNWTVLSEQQDELKEKFGTKRGHADPDYG